MKLNYEYLRNNQFILIDKSNEILKLLKRRGKVIEVNDLTFSIISEFIFKLNNGKKLCLYMNIIH